MITAEMYEEYFGVDTAPTNLVRLEYLALQTIKNMITSEIPEEDDTIYDDFINALLEQIKYFEDNNDIFESITSFNANKGYTLGKFSENNSNTSFVSNETLKRVSPNTYSILLNIGMLYQGLC